MKIEDILNSDKRILDNTSKEKRGDQNVLVFSFGELGTLAGVVPEKLDATIITEWCMAVRREWNARNNQQKAKVAGEAADVRSSPSEAAPAAGVPSGGGQAVPADLQGAKAAMEAGIESALTALGRRRAEIEARCNDLNREVTTLMAEVSNIDDMVAFYENMRTKL